MKCKTFQQFVICRLQVISQGNGLFAVASQENIEMHKDAREDLVCDNTEASSEGSDGVTWRPDSMLT